MMLAIVVVLCREVNMRGAPLHGQKSENKKK
jgi:hypothetical protein